MDPNQPTTLAALAFGLLIACWLIPKIPRIIHEFSSPLHKIPGPWHAQFTNLGVKVATITGRRIYYVHDLHAKYGPIVRVSPDEVAVSDLESHKKIHGAGSQFYKSEWYERLTNIPTLSIFSMRSNKDHAIRRRLFSRAFSKSYLKENWEPVVRDKCWLAVSKIKRDAVKGSTDILKWWTFLATDITGQLSFGESFNMLEVEEKTHYIRVLLTSLLGNGIGAELPLVRAILRNIPIPQLQEPFNSSNYLLDYGNKAVENAKAQNGGKNVFATILAESEKEEGRLTDLDVRIEATNIIVAGSDTAGVTLTYLTWAILRQPELRTAVEEEVAALPEGFEEADLEKLPLLNACFDEALRLYGALPGGLPRVVPTGGATLNGYFIPVGTTVTTQAYTMHRNPDFYPDPLAFNPYRWLDNSMSKEGKAAFTPFGAGARSCLGSNLARMEIRYAIAYFFRELKGARLAASCTVESMEFENFFLIAPKSHRCEIDL